MSVDEIAKNDDKVMLTPNQSVRAGYQYPVGQTQSHEQKIRRRTETNIAIRDDDGGAKYMIEHELGEAPVSVQPTDYLSDDRTAQQFEREYENSDTKKPLNCEHSPNQV